MKLIESLIKQNINNIGILFPGQGIQYVGMLNYFLLKTPNNTNNLSDYNASKFDFKSNVLKDIVIKHDNFTKNILKEKIPLSYLMINDSKNDAQINKYKSELLNRTSITQLAVNLYNLLKFNLICQYINELDSNKNNNKTDIIFHLYGRSLGELSSILISSNLTIEDYMNITYHRGLFIEEEYISKIKYNVKGHMINLICNNTQVLKQIINLYLINANARIQSESFNIAGIHSKKLIVLTGNPLSLNEFCNYLKTKQYLLDDNLKKISDLNELTITIKPLNVAAPYHSELLTNSRNKFYNFLLNNKFDLSAVNEQNRFNNKNNLITFKRYSSVEYNTNSYLDINSLDNKSIYNLLADSIIKKYNTFYTMNYLNEINIPTIELSVDKLINYNDYI